jgi:F0F1-type ATP synthase assembly protein I
MAAQTAVGFIKQGCAFLHEGRMELEGAKKTAEQVIGDVKAIKGIFDWFIGLFVSKPTAEAPKPVAQKKAAAKQQSYEELELKLISEIGANLGVLFDTQQEISNYYAELEETSKTNYDPTQNTSKKAIERALIELQMEKLMEQTREAMVYAPPELKDLYSRFLVMHGKIEREQEWARAEMIRRARMARWRKEQDKIQVIEITSALIAVTFISLFFGWMMWQLRSWSTGF